MTLHQTFTTSQITYQQPPPAGAVAEIVPNSAYLNVQQVQQSELDSPGVIQPAIADVFFRVADPWTVNPELVQFFPVNAPPAP
jgi:hypothetical protein